jgi:hypothetical protein
MSALALLALAGALLSTASYVRTRVVGRALEGRAESMYLSALSLERAADRALAPLIDSEPRPTTAELELNEVLRHQMWLQAHCEAAFAPAQIAFSTWDQAQARRAVELARGTGSLTDGDVDYLDYTRRLGSEITHDVQGKRKLLAAF